MIPCLQKLKKPKNPVKGKDDRVNPDSLVPVNQVAGKIRKREEPTTQSPHAETIRAVGLILGIKQGLVVG